MHQRPTSWGGEGYQFWLNWTQRNDWTKPLNSLSIFLACFIYSPSKVEAFQSPIPFIFHFQLSICWQSLPSPGSSVAAFILHISYFFWNWESSQRSLKIRTKMTEGKNRRNPVNWIREILATGMHLLSRMRRWKEEAWMATAKKLVPFHLLLVSIVRSSALV